MLESHSLNQLHALLSRLGRFFIDPIHQLGLWKKRQEMFVISRDNNMLPGLSHGCNHDIGIPLMDFLFLEQFLHGLSALLIKNNHMKLLYQMLRFYQQFMS